MIKCPKKKANCEGIASQVEGHNSQSLNHFVSESFWNAFEVMNQLTIRTWKYLSAHFDSNQIGLIIDESGFKKHGKHSVCVARQWLGCLGKQDNGQVFVGASLCAGKLFSLIQMRLFMPQSWENQALMRKNCHIPSNEMHLSKTKMAQQVIEGILELGVKPFWIGFDSLYGCCLELLYWIDGIEQRFVGEIKMNTHFYIQKPQVYLPEHKKGRKPKFFKTNNKSISLSQYQQTLTETDYDTVCYRKGTKGSMEALYHRCTVWIWNKNYQHSIECELLIKKEGNELKATLANLSKGLTIKKLAYMQGQRYFIEQSFKESKNQVAIGDYQVRGWNGTHRHLACSMLALNFLMEQRHQGTRVYEHITIPDIVSFINILIPNKIDTVAKMYLSFIEKHNRYRQQISLANSKKQT
jgi:SRSO17 transposase